MNVLSLVKVRIELEQVEYRLGRQAYMKPTESLRLWKMIGSKMDTFTAVKSTGFVGPVSSA